MRRTSLLIVVIVLIGVAGTAAPESPEQDLDELARQLNNPVGSTWNLVYQNNSTWNTGSDPALNGGYDFVNTFNFQPVLPIPVGKNLNLINRPVLPLVAQPSSRGSSDYVFGLGDLVWASWLGPRDSGGLLWSVGFTSTFPTATKNILDYNDWTVGPSFVLFYMGNPLMGGVIYQHWFTYAGDKPEKTNFMNLQYLLILMLENQWQLQMTPNITLNLNDLDSFTFPIGLGATKIVRIGQSRWSFAAELQYYIIKPDVYGPEWNLRILVKQILNSPFL